MLPSRTWHSLKLFLVAFVISGTGYYLFLGDADHNYHQVYQVAVTGRKELFIREAMNTEIDGPVDNSTLVELCASKKWTEGLIFKCEEPSGEPAKIRNVFLNCVRYAIEAGATGFIIPELKAATSTPMGKEMDNNVPFTHLFDLPHFTTALTSACPQIHLYSHQNDLYDIPSTQKHHFLSPESLSPSLIANTIITHPETWTAEFSKWLNSTVPPFTASAPVLVALTSPEFQFPLSYDDALFVPQFGRLIRYREDIRRLAATLLYTLSTTYSLNLSPGPGLQAGKFYGAILDLTSSETDKTKAEEEKVRLYKKQEKQLLQAAKHNNLSLLYLSCPPPHSEDLIHSFSKSAALVPRFPITTVTALSLLSSSSLTTSLDLYQSLSPSHHTAIDSLLLLSSSIFGGPAGSMSAWAIALRRHIIWGNGSWIAQEEDYAYDRGKVGNKTTGMWGGPPGGYGGGGFQSFRDGSSANPWEPRGVWRLVPKEEGGNEMEGEWSADGQGGRGNGGYGLSVVFGEIGEGENIEKGMWP
ncbi:hypothetical protein B7494_g2459 [Chlorociboria aeruginascens]|nr:hypothetical protein B7494_g2459 [Chlorociboria aeruginascens]